MRFARLGTASALIAVLTGAFGAHALRSRLAPELLQAFETGVRYQMYHALALIGVDLGLERGHRSALRAAGWMFAAGTLLFSGSLYALALTGVRAFGAVTPLGGVLFLAGWLAAIVGFAGNRSGSAS